MQSSMHHSSAGHYDQHVADDGPLREASDHSVSLPHLLHHQGGALAERADRNWYRTASNEREGARTNTTVSMGSQWYRSEDDRTVGESQQSMNNNPEQNHELRQPPRSLMIPEVQEGRGGGEGGVGDGGVDLTVAKGGPSAADGREEYEHVYNVPDSRVVLENEDESANESAWKTAGIVAWLILLSLAYILEVISDIVAAVNLGLQGRFGAMAVCGGLVLIPAALLAILSLGLYKRDDAYYTRVDQSYERRFGAISVLLHCILLGPIHRSFKVALAASSHKSQFFEHINRDSALLRYISLMLHTAPQLTLYFTLLLKYSAEGVPIPLTITVSAAISAVSALLIIWSFAANDMLSSRELRQTVAAKVAILNWNAFIIAARIIALGAFASHSLFGLYVFAVVGVHWVAMWVWVGLQRPGLGEDTSTESEAQKKQKSSMNAKLKQIIVKLFWVYYYAIVGMVQLFTFYNIKSGRTRYRLAFYYLLVGAESLGLVLVYHFWTLAWPSPLIVTLECSALAIGVTWMLMYYSILHPTKTEGWSRLGIPPFCCPLCRTRVNTYSFHTASNGDSPRSSVDVLAVAALDRRQPVTAPQRYNNHFSVGSYNEQLKGRLRGGEIPGETDYARYLTQTSVVNSEQTQEVAPSSPSQSLQQSLPQPLPSPLFTVWPAQTTAVNV